MKNKLSSALSQRALLVHVNISQWTGRKLDKQATDTVIKAHKTDRSAGGYTKHLLPGAHELETISTMASQIRTYFYEQTLPWMADGSRIISAKNHLKFASEFRKMKSQFDAAVTEFAVAYPRLQTEAKKRLGGLYIHEEYPDPAEISSKFKCETSFMPLPDVKDFRVEVSEAEKKDFIRKMQETESTAMKDAWVRLHEVVKNAAEKLAKPDAVFRESLLDNVKELCNLLPMLNVTDDSKLESARREVEKLIGGLTSNELRTSAASRSDAAKKLKDITYKMDAFMGGSK